MSPMEPYRELKYRLETVFVADRTNSVSQNQYTIYYHYKGHQNPVYTSI